MISGSVMVVEGAPECWNVDVSNWVTLALGDVSWRLFAALTIVVYSAHFLYIAHFCLRMGRWWTIRPASKTACELPCPSAESLLTFVSYSRGV